jgi:hypothetical protein
VSGAVRRFTETPAAGDRSADCPWRLTVPREHDARRLHKGVRGRGNVTGPFFRPFMPLVSWYLLFSLLLIKEQIYLRGRPSTRHEPMLRSCHRV